MSIAVKSKTEEEKVQISKWFWKMDFCKKRRFAPAQKEMWDIAEIEWRKENFNTSVIDN